MIYKPVDFQSMKNLEFIFDHHNDRFCERLPLKDERTKRFPYICFRITCTVVVQQEPYIFLEFFIWSENGQPEKVRAIAHYTVYLAIRSKKKGFQALLLLFLVCQCAVLCCRYRMH